MDTRHKIVTAEVLRNTHPVVVTGYFDVLTADLVRELRAIRDKEPDAPLAGVVLPREGALLGHRARAELVAALAVIDYVLIAETEDSEALLASIGVREAIRLEAADLARNRQLREHVQRRHSC